MITLSPTSCRVPCAGTRHHLVWRDSRLVAFDHPDPDRERAFTALGGETYRCLQLLQAWERHADDLDVLLLAPRGPQDRLAAGGDQNVHHRHRHGAHVGWAGYAPLTSSVAMGREQERVGLRDVLRLGGGLPDRLAAQVIHSWSARLARGEPIDRARPLLHAALYGRFAAAARTWLGDPDLRIDLTMGPPASAAELERADSGLQVQLSFAWLSDVWLPGFAVIADRLCLSAAQPGPHRFELATTDRGLTERSTVTLEVHPTR